MIIKKAAFLTSAVKPEQYPEQKLPEIALVGKSNVGKSSLINKITNNSKLARTSGQPGKTRLINYFIINECFYMVDLPGYGFARVSKSEQKTWGKMIEDYLSKSIALTLIIQLIDIRHSPTEDDKQMAKWIQHFDIPHLIVATKADKIGKTRWKQRAEDIKKSLDLHEDIAVIPFSTLKDTGKEMLLKYIDSYVSLNNE